MGGKAKRDLVNIRNEEVRGERIEIWENLFNFLAKLQIIKRTSFGVIS